MHTHIGDWALLEQTTAWGVVLEAHTCERLLRYLALLYEANQRVNLTRVPAEQAVGRHLLDSLCLLAVYTPPEGARVLDIGTGAGLPGIPLAVARPDLRLTLLDSHGKTVQFLREACAALGLPATVVQARAEEWAHNSDAREQFDLAQRRRLGLQQLHQSHHGSGQRLKRLDRSSNLSSCHYSNRHRSTGYYGCLHSYS